MFNDTLSFTGLQLFKTGEFMDENIILFLHHYHRDPMRLHHVCTCQCLSLGAVSKKWKSLMNEICTFSFIRCLSLPHNINLIGRNTAPRKMSINDQGTTDSSPDCDGNGEENSSTEMVCILLSLQSSPTQLSQVSKPRLKPSIIWEKIFFRNQIQFRRTRPP